MQSEAMSRINVKKSTAIDKAGLIETVPVALRAVAPPKTAIPESKVR